MSIKLIKFMESLKEFIVNNWQFISTIIVAILTVILALIKKRPVNEIIDNNAYKDLIILVNEAEAKYGAGNGQKKLDYVLTSYCSIKGLNKDSWMYESIKCLVENLLTTPQKKGEK